MVSSALTPHHCFEAPETKAISRYKFLRKVIDKEGQKKGIVFKISSKKFSSKKQLLINFKKSLKTQTREPETPKLPFELIREEILVRLPIKSLTRFKCVSKLWCSVIEDRLFIEKQKNRAAPILLRDCDEISDLGVPRQSYCNSNGFWGYEIVGVFDGLVVQRIWDQYFVKNPMTLQTLTLPDPIGHCHQMLFDFDPCSDEAKLLREYHVLDGDFVKQKGYQILTIGRDEHWRNLTTPRGENLLMASGSENIHFLGLIQTGNDIDIRVSSFDIRSERFTNNDLPRGLFSDMSQAFPFWWNKLLAVADFTSNHELRVSVLERSHEGTSSRWSNLREVPLSFLRMKIFTKERIVPVLADSDDLWFHYDGVCKFSYDMKTDKVKEMKVLANETREVATFEYRPSLRSLKGMKPVIGFWKL